METGSGTHKRGRQPAVTGNEAALRPRRWWVACPLGAVVPTAIGAVLIVVMVAAACGTIKPAPTTATTSTPASTSAASSTTTTAGAGNLGLLVRSRQTAIAGFVAALKAQDAADRAVDPNYPGLAQTEVNPELRQSQDFLTALRINHDTTRGPASNLGHPVIVAYSPTRAVVSTCSAHGLVAYLPNGQPVPGVLGQQNAAVLTGVMVPGEQNWMLKNFAVKVVASCPAS